MERESHAVNASCNKMSDKVESSSASHNYNLRWNASTYAMNSSAGINAEMEQRIQHHSLLLDYKISIQILRLGISMSQLPSIQPLNQTTDKFDGASMEPFEFDTAQSSIDHAPIGVVVDDQLSLTRAVHSVTSLLDASIIPPAVPQFRPPPPSMSYLNRQNGGYVHGSNPSEISAGISNDLRAPPTYWRRAPSQHVFPERALSYNSNAFLSLPTVNAADFLWKSRKYLVKRQERQHGRHLYFQNDWRMRLSRPESHRSSYTRVDAIDSSILPRAPGLSASLFEGFSEGSFTNVEGNSTDAIKSARLANATCDDDIDMEIVSPSIDSTDAEMVTGNGHETESKGDRVKPQPVELVAAVYPKSTDIANGFNALPVDVNRRESSASENSKRRGGDSIENIELLEKQKLRKLRAIALVSGQNHAAGDLLSSPDPVNAIHSASNSSGKAMDVTGEVPDANSCIPEKVLFGSSLVDSTIAGSHEATFMFAQYTCQSHNTAATESPIVEVPAHISEKLQKLVAKLSSIVQEAREKSQKTLFQDSETLQSRVPTPTEITPSVDVDIAAEPENFVKCAAGSPGNAELSPEVDSVALDPCSNIREMDTKNSYSIEDQPKLVPLSNSVPPRAPLPPRMKSRANTPPVTTLTIIESSQPTHATFQHDLWASIYHTSYPPSYASMPISATKSAPHFAAPPFSSHYLARSQENYSSHVGGPSSMPAPAYASGTLQFTVVLPTVHLPTQIIYGSAQPQIPPFLAPPPPASSATLTPNLHNDSNMEVD